MKTTKKLLAGLLAVLQLATPTGAWAQSGPTTNIQYDAVGQVTQVTSPAGRTRQLQWDSLGRLQSETRATSTVSYGYNGQDALTSVTDPRNLTTSYTRNGFGEAKSQTSPDTANSSYVYDLNGNVTSRVNAAGQTESYTYDAADRVLTKTVSHPTQGSRTYTFTYGANGTPEAGALTQVTATGMTLGFAHNLFGQTTSTTQTLTGSVPRTTGYSYATSGAPTGMTYPSGRAVTYTLDSGSRITGISSGGVNLLSNISYTAFGTLAGWTFGSGQVVTHTYDLNGRITGMSMPGGTREYLYDSDSRIVGINDPVLGSATYDYDDLDRLTSASTSLGSWNYQYDATGNRVSSSSATVSIDNYSNRVLSVNGSPSRLYAYTNDGQPRQVDGVTASPGCGNSLALNYQADGQLASSNVLTAVHSPNGLRLQKTAAGCAGGTTTNFVYDLAGHLIGEYDAAGNVIQETVWLGNVPVAVFKPSAAPTPFYVFADNLGSPRAITNASGQVAWRWDGEPFGTTAANSNPSGLGDFTYNLRFPGQYLDVETGFHHNGWREYDPALGRYVQSDPIGLAGGLSTYDYADGNPLSFADPSGENPLFVGLGTLAGGVVIIAGQKLFDQLGQAFHLAREVWGTARTPESPPSFADTPRNLENNIALGPVCAVTRERRWQDLANEPNSRLPKQLVDFIKRHGGKYVQEKFGLELAHPPKRSAAQGFDYSEAKPATSADHRGIQHRYLRESKYGTKISTQRKPRNGGTLDVPPEGSLP